MCARVCGERELIVWDQGEREKRGIDRLAGSNRSEVGDSYLSREGKRVYMGECVCTHVC